MYDLYNCPQVFAAVFAVVVVCNDYQAFSYPISQASWLNPAAVQAAEIAADPVQFWLKRQLLFEETGTAAYGTMTVAASKVVRLPHVRGMVSRTEPHAHLSLKKAY